jgi:hypothetical protein
MLKALFTTFLVIALFYTAHGQQTTRLRCDFSVKTKVKDQPAARLVMGTCYYDMSVGRLIYEIKFPEKEKWIFIDSIQWVVRNDSVIEVLPASIRPELSVIHLSMKQELSHYGLKNSSFTATEVKQDKGLVITTWTPPAATAKRIGKVATSTRDKQLKGVIFYHPKGHMLRKQLFNDYLNTQGLLFPKEVIDIVYEDEKEIWQQTTYSNVVINEIKNNHIYNYMPRFIPASKGAAKK